MQQSDMNGIEIQSDYCSSKGKAGLRRPRVPSKPKPSNTTSQARPVEAVLASPCKRPTSRTERISLRAAVLLTWSVSPGDKSAVAETGAQASKAAETTTSFVRR